MYLRRTLFRVSIAIAPVTRDKNGVGRLSRVALNKTSHEDTESQRERERERELGQYVLKSIRRLPPRRSRFGPRTRNYIPDDVISFIATRTELRRWGGCEEREG